MSELISYDDVIDAAYDIFLEMAPDNLESRRCHPVLRAPI